MTEPQSPLQELLRQRDAIVLDGGTGSELFRRGLRTTLPLWSAHALLDEAGLRLLAAIHADYARAGAEVLTANTFRTTRRALDGAGKLSEWRTVNRLAIEAARVAADSVPRACVVAGSIAPLEDCYRPALAPSREVCLSEHARQVQLLLELGADLLLIETMNCAREAEAAVVVARDCGAAFLVSLCPKMPFHLLSGEPLDEVVPRLIEVAGPRLRGVLLNCASPEVLSSIYPRFARLTGGMPHGLYAHLGEPDAEVGWKLPAGQDPQAYAQWMTERRKERARFVGGCCGTTPDHIAALAARVSRLGVPSAGFEATRPFQVS